MSFSFHPEAAEEFDAAVEWYEERSIGAMSWWRPALKVQSGIFDAEGFFRTGRKPGLGFPLAEIYQLTDADDDLNLRGPPEQERLSRPVCWPDDYFQSWAEALAIEHAGEMYPPEAWIIVAFDAAGNLTASVEYRPVVHNGFSISRIRVATA